jgi:hypothetical protein
VTHLESDRRSSSGPATRTLLFQVQRLAVLASRRSRSGDGRTRTANVAWRMKPAPHLASSPVQGSELHRVRFWPQVMSLVGFCCPDPCGAPAGNRTQCAGFGGPRSFHRQEQVASREGVEPSQAGFVDLPPDPPAETSVTHARIELAFTA